MHAMLANVGEVLEAMGVDDFKPHRFTAEDPQVA
jgi:hypothetical protein